MTGNADLTSNHYHQHHHKDLCLLSHFALDCFFQFCIDVFFLTCCLFTFNAFHTRLNAPQHSSCQKIHTLNGLNQATWIYRLLAWWLPHMLVAQKRWYFESSRAACPTTQEWYSRCSPVCLSVNVSLVSPYKFDIKSFIIFFGIVKLTFKHQTWRWVN